MKSFSNLERAAFDNYDGGYSVDGNDFDPNYATGEQASRQMQINISINNATASQLKVELFSALDSVTSRKKAELVTGDHSMIPLLSYEGLAVAGDKAGTVGFDQTGNLIIKGLAAGPVCTVSCNEYPYNALFESTKRRGFLVQRLRYTVSTDAQIDNTITHFEKTIGGGSKENTISPRAFFQPNQQQGLIVDIPAQFKVNAHTGLLIPVNAGENLRLAMFVKY